MSPSAATAKTVPLRQVSIPRLVFALLHQRFSGTVTLPQPAPHAGQRSVWFEGGMPVFTDWIAPGDALGQILLRARIITPEALERGLARRAMDSGHDGFLGEALVYEGLLTPEVLGDTLADQCMAKLVHTFALRDGEVTVASHGHPHAELVKVNALELLQRGVATHYDEDRIEGEMGAELLGPLRATAAFERYRGHFGFSPSDEPVLDALTRGSSLSQILGLGMPARRSAQLTYTLWASQMLRVGEAALVRSNGAKPVTTPPTQTSRPGTPPPPRPAGFPPPPPNAKPSTSAPPSPNAKPSTSAPPSPNAKPSTTATDVKPTAPPPVPAAGSAAAETSELDHGTANDRPPSEAEVVADLEAFEAKLSARAHAFDLLGVSLDADRKDIRAAWADLSRRVHPDRLQGIGLGHLRTRTNHVFAALSEAHALLSDRDQREALRERLKRGDDRAPSDAAAVARAALEGELIAKDADRLLKASRFDRALERYQAALAFTPDEPDLVAAVAWCRYCLSPRAPSDALAAEKALAAVLARSPNLARAHYFRGLVLRDAKATDAALLAFELALRHDERLIDAERQARAIRAAKMQAQADARKPRGLKGLFGKR